MTPTEAARLLAHCAAFDNRQPSRAANEGWSAALNDIPADRDAYAAVARFYGTPPRRPGERLWIQPHDVRTLRQTIRAERLDGFCYAPAGPEVEEVGRRYVARLRGQQEEIHASGRPAAAPGPRALTGGPHDSVAGTLSHTGREVSDRPRLPRLGPLSVRCRNCRARIGYQCRTTAGRTRSPHRGRRDDAQAAADRESVSRDAPAKTQRRQDAAAHHQDHTKGEPA